MDNPSKINFQKYSTLRTNLIDNNSDSQQDTNQVYEIIAQLVPAYYKYRQQLLNISKQHRINPKVYSTLVLPDEHIKQRIKKCEEQKQICQQKKRQNRTSNVQRVLLTQKLLKKNRKKINQQKQLLKKYEAQQIQAMISKQKKQIKRSDFDQNTFDPQIVKAQKQQNKLDEQENIIQEDEQQQHQPYFKYQPNKKSNKTQQIQQNRKSKKNTNTIQSNTKITNKNNKKNNNNYKNKKTNEINNNRPANQVQSQSEIQKDYKLQSQNQQTKNKKNVKRQNMQNQVSIIKFSYNNQKYSRQNFNGFQQQEESQQQDDFLSAQQDKIKENNLYEVQHNEDTYSQYKPKPYTRHNTPNFDTHSQKVRPNNFFDLQKQKLMIQRQKADRIHNQISIVVGEDDISNNSIQKEDMLILQNLQEIQQNSKNNLFSKKSSGRISARQSLDQFFYSFRYLLSEICELNSQSQCLKYLLKNKQYEILKLLYTDQLGKGPIFAERVVKNIQKLLKNEQKAEANTIINRIFGSQNFVSFQDFGLALSTIIYQNQYRQLSSNAIHSNFYQIHDLLRRIFSIWLQMNYFQQKIRKLAQSNSAQMGQLQSKLTKALDKAILDNQQIQKFMYSTSRNRINLLKIKLFFDKNFPESNYSDLVKWLQIKNIKR